MSESLGGAIGDLWGFYFDEHKLACFKIWASPQETLLQYFRKEGESPYCQFLHVFIFLIRFCSTSLSFSSWQFFLLVMEFFNQVFGSLLFFFLKLDMTLHSRGLTLSSAISRYSRIHFLVTCPTGLLWRIYHLSKGFLGKCLLLKTQRKNIQRTLLWKHCYNVKLIFALENIFPMTKFKGPVLKNSNFLQNISVITYQK